MQTRMGAVLLAPTTPQRRSYLKRKPKPDTSRIAATFLFVMLVAVGVGPRLRVGGLGELDIDLRTQDLLIAPAILYLILSFKPATKQPLMRLWGLALPAFLWCAMMVTILTAAFAPEVNILRRVAFLGRTVELFVLAAVIAGLFLRAGSLASKTTVRALKLAVLANIGWVLYQAVTGTRETLLGGETGNLIESYGPKLVGEASAFGAGQFFVFATALGAALFRSRQSTRFTASLFMVAGVAGAALVESRISLGISVIIVALQFNATRNRKVRFNPFGVTIGILLAIMAALTVLPAIAKDRLSPENIEESLGIRITGIWEPLLPYVLNNPLLGIGPGGLTPSMPRSEAHNIVLRAALDFGVVGGALFIALFVTAVRKASAATKLETTPDTLAFATLCKYGVGGILLSGMVQDALTGVTSSHLAMVAMGLFAVTWANHQNAGVAGPPKGLIRRTSHSGRGTHHISQPAPLP